jgi:hypothetical protein
MIPIADLRMRRISGDRRRDVSALVTELPGKQVAWYASTVPFVVING